MEADLRRELEDAARQREDAQRRRHEATRRLAEVVPRAHAAGMPVTEIAELTGLSRRAVYDLLARNRRN
jgi:DNA invertase Pin-like site-specific DNA recombinase